MIFVTILIAFCQYEVSESLLPTSCIYAARALELRPPVADD